jgi:hypothetical protein
MKKYRWLIAAVLLIIVAIALAQPIQPIFSTFLQLIDVPDSYSGQAGKFTKVNAGETALEFGTPAGAGDMEKVDYDVLDDSIVDGDDTAYGAGWNGDINAASKNAIYDKIEALGGGGDMTKAVYDTDNDSLIDQAAGGTELDTSGVTDGQLLIGTTASNVWALGTITEGLAIDITNGGGSITSAFDPTELLGNRTWGDASTDTIVWTWDRATGTDPTITFNSGSLGFQAFTSAGSGSVGTYFDITPTATQAHSEGRIFYDLDDDTHKAYNAEPDIALNIGEETWINVRNASGSTITNGQVVYLSGATGGRPNIILAKADAAATSLVAGVATHNIENNTDGYITVFGLVRGSINTVGMSGGDQLYLSAATAGALTTTPPTPPNFIIMVARVSTVSANGDIFISPQIDYTDGVIVNSLNTVGDITIHGDDLFMGTNTDRFFLIGDGTNYNPEVLNLGADTTGNYAAGDAEAGAATSGDSATAFFGAGTIEHERGGIEADISAIADGGILVGTGAGAMGIRASALTGGAAGFFVHELGGLEADVSGYSGLLAISGGATSEVDAKSELEAQIADVSDFGEADGDIYTNDHDFGGADLELPQGQTPDTDGDIDLDFTDGSVVIQHGSAHAELAASTDVVVGKLIKSFSATLGFPDSLQAEIDNWPLKTIDSTEFPHGIVVTAIRLTTSESSTYAVNVENWDDPTTINVANPTIDAITTSASTEAVETTITYSTIAAGQIIMLDLPTDDISWITIKVEYYEPIA